MKRKSAVLVAITLSILILPFQTIQGQGQSEVPSSPTGPDGQGASSISRQETFQLPISQLPPPEAVACRLFALEGALRLPCPSYFSNNFCC